MGFVLVARGNEILRNKGYGKANLEQNIPNDPDTKFQIGSLTKQFTAALVLLLQQDAKLRIEDPVRKYLPDAPKSWDRITLTELLGHNSGIPEIQSDPRFRSWAMSPHTHAEEFALFKDRPLNFEPGSKNEYSNSNYLVLGAVIEKVTGEDYGTLLRNRIFKPLGMNDSGVDKDGLVLPKRAQGYNNNNGHLVPAPSESMIVPWSAGSIYSTANDLLRWERGLFGGKVLSAASLKTMTTPGKVSHGFGVGVTTEDGMKLVEHNGAIEGFVAHLAYLPEPRIAVIVLSNVFGGAPPAMGNQLLARQSPLWGEGSRVPATRRENHSQHYLRHSRRCTDSVRLRCARLLRRRIARGELVVCDLPLRRSASGRRPGTRSSGDLHIRRRDHHQSRDLPDLVHSCRFARQHTEASAAGAR